MRPIGEQLVALAEAAKADCGLEVLREYPVERYLSAFRALPPIAPYHAVPAEGRAIAAAVEALHGPLALEAYNRLAMLTLIERSVPGSRLRPTEVLCALLDGYLARIVADMESPRNRYYRHGNDLFAKDFAVCLGKLMPCGPELIDVCAGIGRRIVLQGGLAQAPTRLWFFLARLGGFKPVFELHFDRRLIGAFNEEGYTALYLRLADLLEANPHVKGITSGSWWHDPQLARISPELAFVDRHAKESGARVLRVGEDEAATADALRFAPHRSALHKQGLYQPCRYVLVWPRRELLAWAKEFAAR
jgi:hypothetical protein